MAKSLSDASKSRATTSRRKLNTNTQKAAKAVASKLAGVASTTSGVMDGAAKASTAVVKNTPQISVTVPGFNLLAPDAIASMLPNFNEEAYRITDPLNPPDSLPQATEAQHDRGMKIYKGGIRALQLTGAAFDLRGEVFNVMSKRAKAFGKGIQAATETQKVVGNYVDYLTQLETNQQKEVKLGNAQHKTITDRSESIHTQAELDEKLKQSAISAEKARTETLQKQSQLDDFRQQLGVYTTTAK